MNKLTDNSPFKTRKYNRGRKLSQFIHNASFLLTLRISLYTKYFTSFHVRALRTGDSLAMHIRQSCFPGTIFRVINLARCRLTAVLSCSFQGLLPWFLTTLSGASMKQKPKRCILEVELIIN